MRLTYPVRVPTVSDGEHTHHWELYTCVYKYVFGIVLMWSHFWHFKARSKLFCEIVRSKSESEDSWKVSNEFVGSWIGSQLHCSPFEQLHLVISNLNVKGKIAHGPPPTGVKVNSYASCHYHVQDMSPLPLRTKHWYQDGFAFWKWFLKRTQSLWHSGVFCPIRTFRDVKITE